MVTFVLISCKVLASYLCGTTGELQRVTYVWLRMRAGLFLKSDFEKSSGKKVG